MQAAVSSMLYMYRLRTSAVTQVQISLGCSWKREKYRHYTRPVERMSYDFVFVIEVSFPSRSLCSLIHESVWVKMHNEFIKGDGCNQERYWLNYWLTSRPVCSLWDGQPTLSSELANLIKCTKCYTLTSPPGGNYVSRDWKISTKGILFTGRRLPVSVSWLHWWYWFVTAFQVISSAKVRAACWPRDFLKFILSLFRPWTLLPSD